MNNVTKIVHDQKDYIFFVATKNATHFLGTQQLHII